MQKEEQKTEWQWEQRKERREQQRQAKKIKKGRRTGTKMELENKRLMEENTRLRRELEQSRRRMLGVGMVLETISRTGGWTQALAETAGQIAGQQSCWMTEEDYEVDY